MFFALAAGSETTTTHRQFKNLGEAHGLKQDGQGRPHLGLHPVLDLLHPVLDDAPGNQVNSRMTRRSVLVSYDGTRRNGSTIYHSTRRCQKTAARGCSPEGRIDVACDDREGFLDMDEIVQKIQTNQVNSRMTLMTWAASFPTDSELVICSTKALAFFLRRTSSTRTQCCSSGRPRSAALS